MSTITIPKEITKGEELVVIPKKLYEQFIRAFRTDSHHIKKLPPNLEEALADVQHGRTLGPFSTLAEGLSALHKAV